MFNAKKTMTNGFKMNVQAATNPNATFHGVKDKLWSGFYPKFQQ